MQNAESTSSNIGSQLFNFSNINPEDLKFIQQAENQLNQSRQDKLVLIAYDKTQQ
jgi:hypothetical protein